MDVIRAICQELQSRGYIAYRGRSGYMRSKIKIFEHNLQVKAIFINNDKIEIIGFGKYTGDVTIELSDPSLMTKIYQGLETPSNCSCPGCIYWRDTMYCNWEANYDSVYPHIVDGSG